MPGTGYDEDAMRIGSLLSGVRPWWFKLMVPIFIVAIAVGRWCGVSLQVNIRRR